MSTYINTGSVNNSLEFMNTASVDANATKKSGCPVHFLVALSMLLMIFIVFSGLHSVYAVEIFSKDEKPFNVAYDDWVAKYWNKRVGMNKDQATPKPGGC